MPLTTESRGGAPRLGRLFWKFFLFIYLAQLTVIVAVTALFWLQRQSEEQRWHQLPHEHRVQCPDGSTVVIPRLGHPPPERPEPDGPGPHGFGGPHHPPHPLPWIPVISSLLVSLAFAALLAWYFSKPIRKLRDAFDATAAGNFDIRLGDSMGSRRDELADLGRDFDNMASRLKRLVEGQRRLLHDVSHELRSPLARQQLAIDIARQQPGKMAECLDRIELESGRMDRLVGELLTLSRLDAAEQGPQEAFDVVGMLADIVEDAVFEATARDMRITYNGIDEAVIMGNGELLHRALENVVRNALKHSPNQGRIDVSTRLSETTDRLFISVCDAGPGVPETDLDLIFQPFLRGADSDGYGLGLAIARRVVESFNGHVHARNRAEGGFCVEIELPFNKTARG